MVIITCDQKLIGVALHKSDLGQPLREVLSSTSTVPLSRLLSLSWLH